MFANLKAIFARTTKDFVAAPLILLVPHIPGSLMDLATDLADKWMQLHPIVAIAITLPFYCVYSALTAAWTFYAIQQLQAGQRPSANVCFSNVKTHARLLMTSALCVGAVIALGVAAVILPAIYFMAVYLFVPWIIADNQTDTVGGALARAKRLVIARKWRWVGIVVLMFAIGMGMFFLADIAQKSFNQLSDNTWIHGLSYVVLKLGSSLIVGAVFDVALTHAFIKLKGNVT